MIWIPRFVVFGFASTKKNIAVEYRKRTSWEIGTVGFSKDQNAECLLVRNMGVSKNRAPKMDGENNGKPYEQMDDLGGFPIIFGLTPI